MAAAGATRETGGAAAALILRRDRLTLLENNRALLIIFAGKLAGYFGNGHPPLPPNLKVPLTICRYSENGDGPQAP